MIVTVFSEPCFDCREAASVAANEGTGGGACDSEPVNYSVSPTPTDSSLAVLQPLELTLIRATAICDTGAPSG